MKTKSPGRDVNPVPKRPLPNRSFLDKKAEKYLREGGKIEDMPEGREKETVQRGSTRNWKK